MTLVARTLLEIAGRTAAIYLVILLGVRLSGKREVGQMTPFDLVVILLIANAVQNAMVGPDTSLTGGLLAAGVLIGINYLVAQASGHIPWLRRITEGTPTLLVHDGSFITPNLRREDIDVDEVMMAIREHGLADVADVATAILEVDGSISVVQKEDGEHPKHTVRRRRSRFLRGH